MTAVACMRILVETELGSAPRPELSKLIGRIAGAFLESRWQWPRRYGEIAPCAFVLADPRGAGVDILELQELSRELQVKLFGTEGAGDILLMAFEGEQADVMRFAAAETQNLLSGLDDPQSLGSFAGKISLVRPATIQTIGQARPETQAHDPPAVEPPATEAAFAGVYYLPRETFMGNGITARRNGRGRFHNIADGARDLSEEAALDFDLCCLEAALYVVSRPPAGVLFVPVGFTSIVHRSGRQAYRPLLERLPQALRGNLAVTVYDTPRDPTFSALAQAKAVLTPAFGIIDLHVTDPGFEIQKLAYGAVNSITFVLPEADEASRIAAATRFMRARDHFKAKRIWPAITNVRSKRELDACVGLRVPFLTGRAVCGLMRDPIGTTATPVDALPLSQAPTSRPIVWVA